MSRVSQKSGLSPSATRGSSAIDLGKNSGVDMGRKAQPSVTSGGIGITQEVASVGGASVSLGVGVEISPVNLGISVDPSGGTATVAAGAEIPGGLLGLSGGVTLDLNTGEVIGGSVGGEIAGLGINLSNSRDGGLGIEFTLQIPGTPLELSLGLGFPPDPDPKRPTPTPSPTPSSGGAIEAPGPFPPGPLPSSGGNGHCTVIVVRKYKEWGRYLGRVVSFKHSESNGIAQKDNRGFIRISGIFYYIRYWSEDKGDQPLPAPSDFANHVPPWQRTNQVDFFSYGGFYGASGAEANVYNEINTSCQAYITDSRRIIALSYEVVYSDCALSRTPPPENPNPSSPSQPAPFPNPPPRKQRMDICCIESIKLQRLIVKHLGAARNTVQEVLPDGVEPIGSAEQGIAQAFPFNVKKKWVIPTAKEDERIQILNARQLTLVLGGMIERLESVLGTAEFYKDSEKKLRQSEGNLLSWLTGKNKDFRYPDPNDFWLNTDDGVINEKVLEVRSIADGLRYQIEALNRLERILPIAELKDSSIPARWIYPNGKGQLRVGNLIHLCEYMIRKSDKDMGYWPQKITIKAANPAIEGDEPITSDVHSQADMLRVILQQILDIEGDGDMGSNYDLRRTYLDVMAFQLTAKNNKYLPAITEYLSFDMTEEVSKIAIPFDPFAGQDRSVIEDWWIKFGFGEEKLEFPTKNTEAEIEQLSEGLLPNSELEVNTVKFGSSDEKKDPKTLKEALLEILKHSSASAAAVTEVASEGALERIVDAAGLAQKLTSFLLRRDIRESLGIGDLDTWMASAEKGYTDDLGTESLRFPESNPFEPYGRPTTQNPVIREIDTKEDKAD
jgi:hypothetical protein